VPIDHYSMLIGGEWRASSDGSVLQCTNPFDGEVWADAPAATSDDVDRAVAAARRAFEEGPWADSTPAMRAGLLRRLGDLILENGPALVDLQIRENGKLLRDIAQQAPALAQHLYYFAGIAEAPTGETLAASAPGMQAYTVSEPVGVVAAITPWNSPLVLLLYKLAPALAAGCTIVVKPSEETPVSTLALAGLVVKAGFPEGVVNVVTGGREAGAALVAHADVDKISFTGSTAVGEHIAKTAAGRMARVTLELGGKSPNIVFPDADLNAAIEGVMGGIFNAAGQHCLAGSRVLVHDSIYDRFTQELSTRAAQLRLGDPRDPSTEMGTVANKAQYDKIFRYIEIAKSEGAVLATGGKRPDDPALDAGLFVEPTVFTGVTNDMRVAREEIFGPVAALIRFHDEDEAVRIANDTSFGLVAGVWTQNLGLAHRMTRRLRAGTVWVNTYRQVNYIAPFGGFNESGIGRENGPHAIDAYREVKTVWINAGVPPQ
jgi:(Z)-2-((N-methylformamido)methylene)-5-hydroxybutyrolactone dehydrogenase